MAGVSLKCGDCGMLLNSVEAAQEHAEITYHTNFSESTEIILRLVCNSCGKPCHSKTESDLHMKRTGHTDFIDRSSEEAKPLCLEQSSVQKDEIQHPDTESKSEPKELVSTKVNKSLLSELQSMGFPPGRASRAIYFSGNSSVEAAVNWIEKHENDLDIDEVPLVPVSSDIDTPRPSLTPEEMKLKAQELRERARKKKEDEDKKLEREKEKERVRVGKELQQARRIEEENERKRLLESRKAEKEEERRALEAIRAKLEEDKAERRRRLGLPPEEPASLKPPAASEEKKSSLPVRPATKAEQMRECLRSLKQCYKDDEERVKKAFQTLLAYIRNVAKSPDDEKFRKIRCSNQTFQERVGTVKGGIEFLELCGFEKTEDGEYLHLPKQKVEIPLLNAAGLELNSAINNPFFGVL